MSSKKGISTIGHRENVCNQKLRAERFALYRRLGLLDGMSDDQISRLGRRSWMDKRKEGVI